MINIFRDRCLKIGLICVLFTVFISGCTLVETIQNPISGPERTPTSLINVEMLPTLPTLPPEVVVETPVPESNILYDNEANILQRLTPQPVPDEPGRKVIMNGTVSGVTAYDFQVRDSSGGEYVVVCDDYCFYVNSQKKLIGGSGIQSGARVAVFGVTDNEKMKTILADVIVIEGQPTVERMAQTDMSVLPINTTYTEYELAAPPQPAPLRAEIVKTEDTTEEVSTFEALLAKREDTMLSGMTRYSYGYYGESYTASIQYTTESNRDPLHPTRANMTMYSNAYEFFNFWFPYVENPYFDSSGVINFGGDWFLTIRMTVDINPDPTISEILYSDRTVMSQTNFDKSYRYLRTFGFSIFNYQLFYFFQRENGYGFALNRSDYNLAFDEIVFGLVGDYQDLNPYFADNLVQFFARRGDTWYFVELETPKDPWY